MYKGNHLNICMDVCLGLEDIRNKLYSILNDFKILLRKLKQYSIIDNSCIQPYDILYYIVKQTYRLHNLEIIRCQKLNKHIVNLQLKILRYEYRFSCVVNTSSSSFYKIILDGTNSNRYSLVYEDGYLVGVKLKDNSNVTLFQFRYFAKKMEMFLTSEPGIVIHEHERISLFCSTSISVFPILYTVYEARDNVIRSGMKGNEFLEHIIKYVTFRGFIISLLRRNNSFIMNIN